MVIERNNDGIIIKLPNGLDLEGVQRLINFLMYKEVTKNSKATQKDVDKLAKEVNLEWWERNNHLYIN